MSRMSILLGSLVVNFSVQAAVAPFYDSLSAYRAITNNKLVAKALAKDLDEKFSIKWIGLKSEEVRDLYQVKNLEDELVEIEVSYAPPKPGFAGPRVISSITVGETTITIPEDGKGGKGKKGKKESEDALNESKDDLYDSLRAFGKITGDESVGLDLANALGSGIRIGSIEFLGSIGGK